jgi:phage head maturation protease
MSVATADSVLTCDKGPVPSPHWPVTLCGYAVLYNVTSPVPVDGRGGLYCEIIEQRAFALSCQTGRDEDGCPIWACYNHDPSQYLGDTKNGRLRLFNDSKGVRFELDDVPLPAKFAGMSFGFVPSRFHHGHGLTKVLTYGYPCELNCSEISPARN